MSWDLVFGGVDEDGADSLALDANGRIGVGGYTWGDIDLGFGPHAGAGGVDGFILTLLPK